MLMITFFMVIFATALTSGGFSESVHAFGESPVGYVLLGFALSSIFLFIWFIRQEKKPVYTFAVDKTSLFSVSRFVATGSLIALLIVCFIGALAPIVGSIVIGGPMSIQPEFYTVVCYPFTIAFVAALIGCTTYVKPRTYAILITILIGLGLLMALLGFPTPNALANAGIPILITAGALIVYQWVQFLPRDNSSARLSGKMLVHIAIILILIGVFISSAAQTESHPILASSHASFDVSDSIFALNDFTIDTGRGSIYFPSHSLVTPEYSSLKTKIAITEAGWLHQGSLSMY